MNPVTLPRETVLRLLHQAQLGDAAGLLVQQPGGTFRMRGVDSTARVDELTQELRSHHEIPFAFYRTTIQAGPEMQDLERWSSLTGLFLSVSVGIKGVLQLQAWRSDGRAAAPVELVLADEDEGQNSGVSR